MKTVNYVFLSKNDGNLPFIMKICHSFVYLKIYFEKQISLVFCTTLNTEPNPECSHFLINVN